ILIPPLMGSHERRELALRHLPRRRERDIVETGWHQRNGSTRVRERSHLGKFAKQGGAGRPGPARGQPQFSELSPGGGVVPPSPPSSDGGGGMLSPGGISLPPVGPSAMRSTPVTRSSSATAMIFTPCAFRPVSRISATRVRSV